MLEFKDDYRQNSRIIIICIGYPNLVHYTLVSSLRLCQTSTGSI